MGDYLAAYAEHFALPVRSGTRVERVDPAPDGDGFLVSAAGRRIAARQVVVATGAVPDPERARVRRRARPVDPPAALPRYHDPSQLQDGPVLVVGLSHSGADIAFEAAKTHPTIVSGKAAGQLPAGSIRSAGRLSWPVIAFVFAHVLTIRTPMGRTMRPHVRHGGGPLLRVRLPDLDAAGVERHDAKTVGVQDGKPVLADGTVLDVANVIWCTGYRRDYSWIGAPVMGADGYPDEVRGVSPTVPGLYFLGVPFSYAFTRCSSPVPGVTRSTSSTGSPSESGPGNPGGPWRRSAAR